MIHVGIVGGGNIARFHIEAFLKFPERCTITALCDISPERCREQIEKYGLTGAAIFASLEEMLKVAKNGHPVDLVSICTPPFSHAEMTIQCLSAGLHVITEKPMAVSLEECDAMIAAAQKSGKVFSVVAQNRFLDPIANLKRTLDSGKIGRVLHAQADSYWWRGRSYYDLWWRGTWEKEGGGCTLNQSIHHIDMLGWMLGLPRQISAVLGNLSHTNSEMEDISIAVFIYDDMLAQVTSSVIHHGEEQQLIVQGEKARISAPWKVYASVPRPNGFPVENTELEKELTAYYESLPRLAHTGHAGQIDDVLTAVETGSSVLGSGTEGRRTIELITAIYKAGSTKGIVDLPITKDDPFYTLAGLIKQVPHFYKKTASLKQLDGDITVGGGFRN
ncbi:oxidoreductase [Spirochaetia bacterium]|nr:oxidoreductase [Spirochaetia bacterium]